MIYICKNSTFQSRRLCLHMQNSMYAFWYWAALKLKACTGYGGLTPLRSAALCYCVESGEQWHLSGCCLPTMMAEKEQEICMNVSQTFHDYNRSTCTLSRKHTDTHSVIYQIGKVMPGTVESLTSFQSTLPALLRFIWFFPPTFQIYLYFFVVWQLFYPYSIWS